MILANHHFQKSLDLPTLSSLDLTNFAFYGDENRRAEPFLGFTRLNCLSLSNCIVRDAEILNLSSETLVNLAIHRPTKDINIAVVNNPSDFAKIELYAPNLSTFTFTGSPDQKICGTGLSSAKQVNIHAIVNSLWKFLTDHEGPPMVLLSWLQDLVNVKSMTLSSTTLQVLFLVPDLSEVRLPSLHNLKSMKIELIAPISQERLPFIVMDVMLMRAAAKSPEEAAELRKQFEPCWRLDPIPDGVLNFLIQNSPSTNIDITSATPGAYIEYLKQGTEAIISRLLFGAPASSSTAPASAPASSSTSPDAPASSSMAPASTAAPPNLHLCHASSSMTPVSASAPASSSTTPASTAAPASSSTAPASTALPASSAPPNLHLCHPEKDYKSSNEDKVELRQSNTDSPILDNGQ
ncbi:unnamed protein product [Trifolium pratense]|uniref:Uncharacterized protein n=1 Tax=Trifolium pratense TaxID=57577 RepID=A0ACB0MCL4_TRIPR|nr:unnamed protein product [Trifolium pratense]